MSGYAKAWREDTEAVESRRLTIQDLGLSDYIKRKIDHRTGFYRTTLADLKGATAFPGKRTEYLRQRLHVIKAQGLLSVEEPVAGGREWVFSDPRDTATSNPTSNPTPKWEVSQELETTSKSSELVEAGNPHEDNGSSASRPPSNPSGQEAEVEVDVEDRRNVYVAAEDDEDASEDNEKLLASLALTEAQRQRAKAADPALVRAWIERATQPDVDNRAAYFVAGIASGEPPTSYRDPSARKRTGVRAVRGTHGLSYIHDPDGTDIPPPGFVHASTGPKNGVFERAEAFIRNAGWQYRHDDLAVELPDRFPSLSGDEFAALESFAEVLRLEEGRAMPAEVRSKTEEVDRA